MAVSRKKVLWVDDEIEFLRSHIMFLETRGYSVTPVFSGDDAIHVIHKDPKGFDIVLLDEQMIGKDGLTTLEEIKDFLPDLPVVMVTKSEEESVMEDAMGKKIDGYLTKPVNPSQILSVCKRLLDSKKIISSQIVEKFGRNYSEIRTIIQGQLDSRQWVKLHEHFIKWDIELEKVEDEGIRQTHIGQKSDANVLFSDYIIGNYVRWTRDESDSPLFSPKVIGSAVVPRLKNGENVFLFVFDSMRFDQYIAIEPLLRKYFSVERGHHYSIIPSSPFFTRRSLFSGKYPVEIAERYPEIFLGGEAAGSEQKTSEERLFRDALAEHGFSLQDSMVFEEITDMADSQELLANLDNYRQKRMVVVLVDFISMLIQNRTTSRVIREIAPDETAFRRLTQSWFQYSNIFQVFKDLSRQECTVIFTSSNGSVLTRRGTEIYGDGSEEQSLRYRFGDNITSDERHALFISEPAQFMLPAETLNTCGIILRENYYFIRHDKFENYQRQYQNSFEHGGISMDEMIVPLSVLCPL